MVILRKDAGHSLIASGHPSEGFALCFEDGEQDVMYEAKELKFLPMEEVIAMFQAYARGEDWGKNRFEWDRSDYREGRVARVIKITLLGGFLAYMAFFIVKAILRK